MRRSTILWENIEWGFKPDVAVAREIGCIPETVRANRKRLGIPSRQERLVQLIMAVGEAVSPREIARMTGFTLDYVRSVKCHLSGERVDFADKLRTAMKCDCPIVLEIEEARMVADKFGIKEGA